MKINQDISIKENKFSLRQRLFLFFLILSMIPLFFAAKSVFTVFGQIKERKEKTIKKYTFDNEPIEFVKIESDGKTVKSGEKFIRDDDWLKDFTIKFKNISGKPITYVSIVILFPETGSSGPPISHPLNYGVHRLAKPNSRDKTQLLAPNEMAEVKLSDESFKAVKNFLLSKSLLSNLTEANFRIMTVHFEDGMNWTAGSMFRPDPNNPGKSIAVDSKPLEEEK